MASTADILRALFARAALLETTGPALPIAWPEWSDPATKKSFEPPADGKYLDVRNATNAPAWQGLSSGVLRQGILTVTVVWPKNEGVILASAAADQVKAHFAKNLIMRHGSAAVQIDEEPWDARPLSEASSLQIPITVAWVAS